jgi:hypothetical protein
MNKKDSRRRIAYMERQARKDAIMARREEFLSDCELFPGTALYTRTVNRCAGITGGVVVIKGAVYAAHALIKMSGILVTVMTHRFTRDVTVFVAGKNHCTATYIFGIKADQTFLESRHE